MVQVFDPTPRPSQAGQLGQALGQGIGKLYQENQQEKQAGILSRALSGQASEQEIAQLDPKHQIEIAKLRAKSPAGGLSGQPVPPAIAQLIPRILNENQDANADELAAKFDEAIPRAYSNSYIENRRRRDDQRAKDAIADRKAEIDEKNIGRKERLELHKLGSKYDEGLTKRSEAASRKLNAIERQQKIQPNITNWNRWVAAIFDGTKFQDIFKSQSAQEFDALALPMIEGQKENFGVRLSDADLKLILQKIATSTKNPEANKKIMEWQRLESQLDVEKRKIGDQIKKDNGGYRPLDFEEQVRKKMDEQFGDEIEARASGIMNLEDDPANVARYTQRRTVEPGTPVDNSIMDMYLKLAGRDVAKAEKMARDDGYEF